MDITDSVSVARLPELWPPRPQEGDRTVNVSLIVEGNQTQTNNMFVKWFESVRGLGAPVHYKRTVRVELEISGCWINDLQATGDFSDPSALVSLAGDYGRITRVEIIEP